MINIEPFSELDELEQLVQELGDVSKLPPGKVFAYLIELSGVILSLHIAMRDSIPRGYGRVKF